MLQSHRPEISITPGVAYHNAIRNTSLDTLGHFSLF
jgi:hypothetical protein